MSIQEYHNLEFGTMVFHSEFKRLFIILVKRTNQRSNKRAYEAKTSMLSLQRVYFYEKDAKYLTISHS
jgi:hypothetical protein